MAAHVWTKLLTSSIPAEGRLAAWLVTPNLKRRLTHSSIKTLRLLKIG
jgi:hypothetical protein